MAVYLYLGAPGSGKSTLIREHVYRGHHDVRAFLIIDRDGKGTWHGPVFTSTAAVRALEALPRWIVFRGVRGCDVAELAIALGDCVIVDEEVHRTIAEAPWKPWQPDVRKGHPLYAVLHEGRHLENAAGEVGSVSALIATHRPSNLPGDLPALCDGVYLGRLPATPTPTAATARDGSPRPTALERRGRSWAARTRATSRTFDAPSRRSALELVRLRLRPSRSSSSSTRAATPLRVRALRARRARRRGARPRRRAPALRPVLEV